MQQKKEQYEIVQQNCDGTTQKKLHDDSKLTSIRLFRSDLQKGEPGAHKYRSESNVIERKDKIKLIKS